MLNINEAITRLSDQQLAAIMLYLTMPDASNDYINNIKTDRSRGLYDLLFAEVRRRSKPLTETSNAKTE